MIYGEVVVDVFEFGQSEGEFIGMVFEEWWVFVVCVLLYVVWVKVKELGVDLLWDCELVKILEGYYQICGGILYVIVKLLVVVLFVDIFWMEIKIVDFVDV